MYPRPMSNFLLYVWESISVFSLTPQTAATHGSKVTYFNIQTYDTDPVASQ
jgi:hypothetical protein